MAAPGGKYLIHDQLDERQPHHESFKNLWEIRWKPLAQATAYPFLYTNDIDFEPIAQELIKLGMKEPYEWQSFASVFNPYAEKLFETASIAEGAGQLEKASEYYLRACSVWFIARYPYVLCDAQRHAWEMSKVAGLRGLQLRGLPFQEQLIPHKYALSHEGKQIPAWVLLPEGSSKDHPAPVVLCMGGLDAWRPEAASASGVLFRSGIGIVIVEVPGTGDSPALIDDPLSPDRQWSSLLDWFDDHEAIDSQKVVGWGFSTGGFYAIRVAYTHPTRFLGVVAHGGACHYAFDQKWLENIDQREYAHSATEAFAWKWGFKGDKEKFRKEASDKFSLLKDGTLDKPVCARLLLVNGMDDGVFPIDDSYLCLEHGPPKEARFFRGEGHMGGPKSYGASLSWIISVLGIEVNLREKMSAMVYTNKY